MLYELRSRQIVCYRPDDPARVTAEYLPRGFQDLVHHRGRGEGLGGDVLESLVQEVDVRTKVQMISRKATANEARGEMDESEDTTDLIFDPQALTSYSNNSLIPAAPPPHQEEGWKRQTQKMDVIY